MNLFSKTGTEIVSPLSQRRALLGAREVLFEIFGGNFVRFPIIRPITSEMETREIRQVIEQVLAGETREFARLVEEFGLPVRAFIHSRVQSRADAEDLAQETFIAAFRGLRKFDLEASFEVWLIGIARHRVQGHFRSTNRRQAAYQHFREACLMRIEAELDAVEKNKKHHQLARLMDCIEQLPEQMRRVVRARLREESGAATAERLQTSRGAVYMLQLRANRLLRDCIKKEPA